MTWFLQLQGIPIALWLECGLLQVLETLFFVAILYRYQFDSQEMEKFDCTPGLQIYSDSSKRMCLEIIHGIHLQQRAVVSYGTWRVTRCYFEFISDHPYLQDLPWHLGIKKQASLTKILWCQARARRSKRSPTAKKEVWNPMNIYELIDATRRCP